MDSGISFVPKRRSYSGGIGLVIGGIILMVFAGWYFFTQLEDGDTVGWVVVIVALFAGLAMLVAGPAIIASAVGFNAKVDMAAIQGAVNAERHDHHDDYDTHGRGRK